MSWKTKCISRHACAFLAALAPLLLSACEGGGNFNILGYTTRPNYNTEIRTVRVPIFKNETYYRGLEFKLTEAVIREIELKTPYKIVTAGCPADTELTGKIITYSKNLVIPNQLDEVREMENTLAVEVVWRDLRPDHAGEFLSVQQPKPPSTENINPPSPPKDPPKVLVQSLATFHPELGEGLATAQKRNVDRLAQQIVNMMETPW
jgi:hypothetical protein